MNNYLTVIFNHFRALQSWMKAMEAESNLDMQSFDLEVRCRHRFYKLFPQFLAKKQGRFVYEPRLTEDSIGFIGWLPYRSLSWELSSDKLVFKEFLRKISERTPQFWTDTTQVEADYVLKGRKGSFGDQLAGPFRLGAPTLATPIAADVNLHGSTFAEQFIYGDILKVWFWGETPFYAQRLQYPWVQGDGTRRLGELIETQMGRESGSGVKDDNPNWATLYAVISYQELNLNDIPDDGQRIWLDYRYARTYSRAAMRTTNDNAMPQLSAQIHEQIGRLGRKLADELQKQFPAPVLFSLDGVIDAGDKIWWLEMNSNPIFPPDGYPLMLASLFGAPPSEKRGMRVDLQGALSAATI